MTYDWNKQVEITVPTGTNGWIYSGEVIINGVKVRFPVGVPTTVPEPAAALLNKMIELEREEENNTAKPDNHYVGSVTIPEGKTLTLAKGAKVVDEDGLLGGSSTPAPVVILPETELMYIEDAVFMLTSPPSATPTEGATAVITYNGVEYTSPILRVEADGRVIYAMGNVSPIGMTGGNPDAPFCVALMPDGMEDMYAQVTTTDGATSVTLSIVQTEGASEDSGNAGGLYVVKATEFTGPTTINGKQTYTLTLDKGYTETVAALIAGKQDVVLDITDLFGAGSFLRLSACAIVGGDLNFAMYTGGASYLCEYAQDGTATLTLSVS